MSTALTFASLVIAIWAAGMSLHTHVTRVVFGFLLAQSLFTLVCWLAAQQWSNVHDYYTIVYGVGVLPAAVLAVGLSLRAVSNEMWPLIIAEILTLTAMLYIVQLYWGLGPWPYQLTGFVAAIYMTSGFFLLLSLASTGSPAWDWARLIIGIFLGVEGTLHLLLVANAAAHRTEMIALSRWAPALVAIGLFLWLGHALATAPPAR